jgi:hypothetical protein
VMLEGKRPIHPCGRELNGGTKWATTFPSPSGNSRCDTSAFTSGNDAADHRITMQGILLGLY